MAAFDKPMEDWPEDLMLEWITQTMELAYEKDMETLVKEIQKRDKTHTI